MTVAELNRAIAEWFIYFGEGGDENYKILGVRRIRSSQESHKRQQIEDKMLDLAREMMPAIIEAGYSNMLMLMWWNSSPSSRLREFIEEGMHELYSKRAPNINMGDHPRSVHPFWDCTSPGSKTRRLVEDNILQLLKEVDPKDPPGWVIELTMAYAEPEEAPPFLFDPLFELFKKIVLNST